MATIPKVTVLMTVYNDQQFVASAIKSVLAQTFTDFEFVVIDDGSTDSTPDILHRYAQEDSRIRVFRQSNAGTTAASNYGLSVARGIYLARLDSDDISYPHRLQVEVDFLDRNPDVGLVGGGSEIIDVDGNIIGVRNILTDHPHRTLLHRCIYQQSDVMFRLEIARKLGGYRDKFRNAQDYDLWLRFSDVVQVAKMGNILGQWRLNGSGYTISRKREQAREVRIIKSFALQRRRFGLDDYNNYAPPPPALHRQGVAPHEYAFVVGGVLLQATRTIEARARLRNFLYEKLNHRILILYALTFFPPCLIRWLFAARDFRLNHLG